MEQIVVFLVRMRKVKFGFDLFYKSDFAYAPVRIIYEVSRRR
jgi:hypothetical protein